VSDILEEAKRKFRSDKDNWSDIYENAADDLRFLSDDPFAQWDKEDYQARVQTGRPALTVDQLGQFIHQVANDIRMNTPTIQPIPANNEASEALAEIHKGLIREIEYYSNADDIYDTASLNSIRCSIGWMRVDFEYDGNDGFDQRLCMKRVFNPLSVWIDSNSVECDGRDAKHGTIIEKISVSEFKRRFPGYSPVCFEEDTTSADKYSEEDYISIAEHFVIEEDTETITSEDGQQSREVTNKTVKRYILSGSDILEEGTFPGEYIPLVPVYGEEAWVDGKRRLFSLIRKSKSAQQMFNYWKSLETELLMKAPQAPVMAAEGQVEDYAQDWKNPQKSMVLRYKQTDSEGNQAPPPARLEPPTIPTGVVNAARQTVEDIKATMGIYNAGLGQPSNEQTGIAIRNRQQEGDVATFHFQDNLVRSITHIGRILVSAIPEIYSSSRVIRILGMEDEPKNVGINGALEVDQPESFYLNQGSYEVRVKTGGSYTTRRQEAAEFLSNMVNTSPEMLQIMGDLLFENMDFSGANVMAERMKKVIDPKYLQDDDEQDPMVVQLQEQLQQMQAGMQQLQAQLEDKNAELQIKAQAEQNDLTEAEMKTQLEYQKLQMEQQNKQYELQIKEQELALRQQEVALKEKELELEALQQRPVAIDGQI